MKPVVIFTATRWELQAVHRAFPSVHAITLAGYRCLAAEHEGRTYWLVRTGIGPDAACRAARAVLSGRSVESVISAGFACAMKTAQIGDLIIGEETTTIRRNGSWGLDQSVTHCDERLRARLLLAARQAGVPVSTGSVISAPSVVCSSDEKRMVSRLSGAAALDMESAALGTIVSAAGVPFGIARTVSDLVNEDLPVDFNLFLAPGGWLKGLRALLTEPACLSGLNRLRRQSRIAADRLTKLFVAHAGELVDRHQAVARS